MISTSKINTYRHCPHKFYLQYILKIKTDVKSPALELGSRVHASISSRNFESADPPEKLMLSRAKGILDMYPPNPILETTYEDPNNPGRFYGDVLGERAVGIFDFHWTDLPFAGDWKTGKFDPRFTDSYEVQAYILNELYKQKYDRFLKGFSFEFLKVGKLYDARCLADEKVKQATEWKIGEVMQGIAKECYDRQKGPLCNWCEFAEHCKKI